MKAYQIYFIILKILVVAQIAAIYFKKHTEDSDIFIISDTVFKLSAGIFLISFFLIHKFPGLEFEDTLILRFAGVIILFDIDYLGLLKIISKYVPLLGESISPLEKTLKKLP